MYSYLLKQIKIYFGFVPEEELWLKTIKRNGLNLRFVPEEFKSYEMCLAAVEQNGLALEFVEEQTEELCLAAVEENGLALKFVKHQTYDIFTSAIINNVDAEEFLSDTFQIHKESWGLVLTKNFL